MNDQIATIAENVASAKRIADNHFDTIAQQLNGLRGISVVVDSGLRGPNITLLVSQELYEKMVQLSPSAPHGKPETQMQS